MENKHSIVWCIDSPGWGGSEVNLARVWELLNIKGQYVIHNQEVAQELKTVFERHKAICIQGCIRNSAFYIFQGLQQAFRWLDKFPKASFIVWMHHSDSNRWLQLALALRKRDYVLVEQLVPVSRTAFQKSRLSIPIKRFTANRARNVILNGHSQVSHYRDLFKLTHANLIAISSSRSINLIHRQIKEFRKNLALLRNSLKLQDQPIILCLARLADQKDQATLIHAFAKLQILGFDAQLVLVGDGPDKTYLEQLVDQLRLDNVTFAGYQANPLSWLAVATIFVLPSLAEGLPGALIEAMAAGLPCITTDIPGNSELVRHEETGLLVPTSDPVTLSNAIGRLLQDPRLAKNLAQKGYELVVHKYDEKIEQASWSNLLSCLK